MKKRMLLALMMLSLVIFAGCGKEEEAVSDKNENKTEISTGNKEQEMPKAEVGIADAEGIVFDTAENTETENAESVTSEEENADAVEDVKGETSKNIESEKEEPKKEESKKEESKNEKPEKEESKKEESKKEEPKKEESKKEEGSKGEENGVPAAPSRDEEETGLVEPEGPKSEEPEGPKTEEPESPKTEKPESPKTEKPESPKTENQEGKPETTPSTEDENEDVAVEEMTYEEFQSMSPADQQKYMESFDDIAAFFDWYNRVKTEYEKENPPILLEGNEIDLSDYLRGE